MSSKSKRTKPKREGLPMCREHFNGVVRLWTWLFDATDRAVTAWINRPRIGDTRPGSKPAVFKPRDHFRADGKPKVKYTEVNAKAYCLSRGDGFSHYRCSVCQAWHVGHKFFLRKAA